MALRDIIGQDKAVNILLRTIQRGRVPSSYLFAGESGIGKKLTAFNLAKAVNCLKMSNESTPPSPPIAKGVYEGVDACDECTSCKKIGSGVHPDFLFISPEGGQIRIEEIRAIDDLLSYKPFEGRVKVVIVDEADTMNTFAANAFLKTLEQPPKDSLIILISSNPERLLDTIRSRCSRINFTTLSNELCEKVIKIYINKKDNKKTSEENSTLVRLSMGRPGLAIVGDLIEDRTWFMKLLKEMLNTGKDNWTSREEMERWFDFMLILLRDMATIKITRDEINLINVDLKKYLNKLSSSMDLKVIIEIIETLTTLRRYFNFNLNRSLTWNYTGSLLRRSMNTTYA